MPTKPPPATPGSGVLRAGWAPPTAAAGYLPAIRTAELAQRLPANLLARVLYQESRYRPDIIDGRVRSSAGAVGIAQIVPRYHPTVNALDPFASITYAARYLADLRRRLGSWEHALAGYNWGPGNVSRVATGAAWLAKAPAETQRYVAEILADVPAAKST
jgi:soluble lytic murein transglycosylase-like protein